MYRVSETVGKDHSVKCLDTSIEHKTTLFSAYGALMLPFGLSVALLVALWRLNLNGGKSSRIEESMTSMSLLLIMDLTVLCSVLSFSIVHIP